MCVRVCVCVLYHTCIHISRADPEAREEGKYKQTTLYMCGACVCVYILNNVYINICMEVAPIQE